MGAAEAMVSPGRSMGFAVRPMEHRDIPQVAEIEREAFPHNWPPTPLGRELRNRLARYQVAWECGAEGVPPAPRPSSPRRRSGLRGLLEGVGLWPRPREVAPRLQDHIVGYVATWFLADEAHIIAIAVRQPYRGRGIGELLLISALELAMLRGSRYATLEVRVSNHIAQNLYLKYGFQRVGLRKAYYADNREDAYVMSTGPLHRPDYQARFRALVEAHARRWGPSHRVIG